MQINRTRQLHRLKIEEKKSEEEEEGEEESADGLIQRNHAHERN